MSSSANDTQDKSIMSSEAFGLLDCFVSGLDDLIYEIAEEFARQQGKLNEDGLVVIETDDIQRAAEAVFQAVKRQIAESTIPAEVGPAVDKMYSCLLEKCREADRKPR